MNDFEKRECDYLYTLPECENIEVDWTFFALFSNVVEKLNGGVSYVS